jgi:hypothetical protein
VSSCTALSSFPPQTVIRNIYSRAPNIGSTLCLFYLPTRGINPSIEPAGSPGLCLCLCDNIPFDLYYPGRVSYLQEPGHGLWVLKSLYHPCLRHCQHLIEVVPTAESQSRGVYMSVDPINKFLVLLTKPSFYCNILVEGKQNYLDLFIEPRRGLTRDLLTYSKLHHGGSDCLALFNGPHGISAPIDDYEIVPLIASGLA